jgi:hypothetical protein
VREVREPQRGHIRGESHQCTPGLMLPSELYHPDEPSPPPRLTTADLSARAFPLYSPPPTPDSSSSAQAYSVDDLPSIASLQRTMKQRLTVKATANAPELDEAALRAFYRNLVTSGSEDEGDLLRIGAPGDGVGRLGKVKRREIIEELGRRLEQLGLGEIPSGGEVETGNGLMQSTSKSASSAIHRHVAAMLSTISLPSTSTSASHKGKGREIFSRTVPLGLVSRKEWNALFEEFVSPGRRSGLSVMADE